MPQSPQRPQQPQDPSLAGQAPWQRTAQSAIDTGVQGILGLVGLGDNNSRANQFGQLIAAGAPLAGQASHLIAWLPHPGGGHIPVRIPHPSTWGAAGVGAGDAASAAATAAQGLLPQARPAGGALAAQRPMSAAEQLTWQNTPVSGNMWFNVGEAGLTPSEYSLDALEARNAPRSRAATRPTAKFPKGMQYGFEPPPADAPATPGSAAVKFMRQNQTESDLARERQQMSRSRR